MTNLLSSFVGVGLIILGIALFTLISYISFPLGLTLAVVAFLAIR